MTGEAIDALFDKHDGEFLHFERIPPDQRRHPRPDLCAMVYLHERFGGSGDAVSCARHDEIWLDWDATACELTEEDVVYLRRCGVRFDCDNDSFCLFV